MPSSSIPPTDSSNVSEVDQPGLDQGTVVFEGKPEDSERTVIRDRQVQQGKNAETNRLPSRMGWQAAAESLVGQQLDHYRIEILVGIGGMGAVFRGQDIRLDRDVAIKAIPSAGRDPEAMRRFRFEAQSAAKLDHPNIARVYYVGETTEWSYIVFEFVEGINLRDLVLRQGPMSVDQSVYLVRQVAQALQHASDRQVVHRDIKPSNIVLTPAGQAKIVDMGLARVNEIDRSTNDLTASGVTLGTFDYISPEQAHDPRVADVRSDIYSLGCTWYFLLTGSPPFPEGTALQKLLLHGTKMPDDPRILRPELSDSLIAILRKMIAKRPGDRYQQPIDLIDDLQTLAILEGLTWTRDTDPREPIDSGSSMIWRGLAPFLAAACVMVGIGFWLHNEGMRNSLFTIPRVVISENPSPQTTVPNPTVTTNDTSPSVVAVPADAGTIVVDPRFTKDQIDTNRQLATTIEQAIERFNLAPEANRIVLFPDKIVSRNTLKSLNRNRSRLTIQSKPGSRCLIEVDLTNADSASGKYWLECGTQIDFEDCDLVWKNRDVRQSLFLCRTGSQLSLRGCSVLVENPVTNSNSLPSIVKCEGSLVGNNPDSSLTVGNVRLNWRDVVIAGHVDAVQSVAPVRLECQWSNSVISVGGTILHLARVNAANRGNSLVRMDLESVTTWTPRSWIYATWVSGNTTPMQVIRTARQCVFGGMEALVLWDVAANEDWAFWEQSARGKELSRWLDLRGSDNCYDETATKQLVEARLRNGMTEQLPLSADAKLLSDERGLELSIPWKKMPEEDTVTTAAMSPLELELIDSSFPHGADVKMLANRGIFLEPRN